MVISTASGALVVGGVRDIYMYVYSMYVVSGDRFECSKLFNGEDQTRPDQSVLVCWDRRNVDRRDATCGRFKV